MSYTLRVPILLYPGVRVVEGEPLTWIDDFLEHSIRGEGDRVVWKVTGFANADAAATFINRALAAAYWATLTMNLSGRISRILQQVAHVQADPNLPLVAGLLPEPAKEAAAKGCTLLVRGIDGDAPSVYPAESHPISLTSGSVQCTIGANLTSIRDRIRDGLKTCLLDPDSDPHIVVALDLFNASSAEQSGRAKLVTIVAALEALVPSGQEKSELACKFLEGCITQCKSSSIPDDEKSSLTGALHRLREVSVSASLAGMAQACSSTIKPKRAKEIYNLRSQLVHTGKLDEPELGSAYTDARTLLRDVLKAKLSGKP